MKQRKKFFETDVGKVLKGAATVLAPNLVSVLEKKTSVEDVLKAIKASDETPEVKLKLEELALEHEEQLTRRLESDNAQELWLPKLVRPITLGTLVLSYVVGFFLEYDVTVIHPPLMTVFGFYFGGRSLEKLFKKHV